MIFRRMIAEMNDKERGAPWYSAGLKFTCTGCGACCTGTGRVWLNEGEIRQMAAQLGQAVDKFVGDYIERREGRWALQEDSKTGDCVFLNEGRCGVYQARPRQCRTFPWWPSTLKDKAAWAETKRVCEGVDHPEAPLIPLKEIQRELTIEMKGREARFIK